MGKENRIQFDPLSAKKKKMERRKKVIDFDS